MGFLSLFLSILAESAGNVVDKVNFHRTKTTPQLMTLIIFITMTVAIASYIVLSQQSFPALPAAALGLLCVVAFFSFTGNVFDVLSLKTNDLSLREPLVNFEPVLAGLVAYFLYPDQRQPIYLVAFFAATVIVFWGTHRRKLPKKQRKGLLYMVAAVILYAILPSVYQEALAYMSPAYLALFRVASIMVLTAIFFQPHKLRRIVSAKGVWFSIIAGGIYAVGAVASLYAIELFGVVLALVVLMLGPALRYLAGYFLLNEKVRRGEVASSFVLTIIVAIAALTR